MKGFEIKYNERIFFVPAEPVTAVLIYQRYGCYYADLEGWELETHENLIPKKRFNLSLGTDDVIQLEMRTIGSDISSRFIHGDIEKFDSFPLSEEDIQQMIAKFQALKKMLKKERVI